MAFFASSSRKQENQGFKKRKCKGNICVQKRLIRVRSVPKHDYPSKELSKIKSKSADFCEWKSHNTHCIDTPILKEFFLLLAPSIRHVPDQTGLTCGYCETQIFLMLFQISQKTESVLVSSSRYKRCVSPVAYSLSILNCSSQDDH